MLAAANYLDVIEDLIEASADVNPTNEDSTPALMIAADEGHLAIVKTLIAA